MNLLIWTVVPPALADQPAAMQILDETARLEADALNHRVKRREIGLADDGVNKVIAWQLAPGLDS